MRVPRVWGGGEGEGWGPEGWGPEGVGPRRGGAPKGWGPEGVEPRRGGAPKGWGPEGGGAPKGWGPEGWSPEGWGAPKGGGPKRWGPQRVGGPTQKKWGPRRVGPRRVGAQNFALFFPSPAAKFVLFFPLWGFSRGILVVFKAPGPEMCTFGVLGLSCASPGGPVWWAAGVSPDSPRVQTCTFQGSCLQKHHQNSTRIHPEREEQNEFCGGRGKKKSKFWAVPGRAVPGRAVPGRAVREGRSRGHRT